MANDLTWVFRFAIEAMIRIGGILGYMFICELAGCPCCVSSFSLQFCRLSSGRWVDEWRLALVAIAIIPVVAAINKFYGEWLQSNATQVQVCCPFPSSPHSNTHPGLKGAQSEVIRAICCSWMHIATLRGDSGHNFRGQSMLWGPTPRPMS